MCLVGPRRGKKARRAFEEQLLVLVATEDSSRVWGPAALTHLKECRSGLRSGFPGAACSRRTPRRQPGVSWAQGLTALQTERETAWSLREAAAHVSSPRHILHVEVLRGGPQAISKFMRTGADGAGRWEGWGSGFSSPTNLLLDCCVSQRDVSSAAA